MSLNGRNEARVDLRAALARTASAVLAACAARSDEQIVLLRDDDTAEELTAAFVGSIAASLPGADPVIVSVAPRQLAFADLPPHALEMLLAADLVLDLTTVPWLYSDSFTSFVTRCQETGSRLALIWGTVDSLSTLAACPPSPYLTARARRGLEELNHARTLRVRSPHGTDFTVSLGDPASYRRGFIGEPPATPGSVGAPLCASVTAPFVPGTAEGTIAFAGAGRFQGPENRAIRAEQPVTLTIEAGQVTRVAGHSAAGVALADWFAAAGHDDVFTVMDCNVGFDPRADLHWADNTVVHSFAGGVMIGIGNPYTYRPEGSHRPGYHLDLMCPSVDVDLDGDAFIRGGRFVADTTEDRPPYE